ncbi:16S rRNA (guanine(527)-N(7))-methyltransferase RsmG [Pannus brasiliensis CCIBt3594]|uniref:Ribosomal RNA small subunit methyltransferase G n=1 Tax=Pannus brasiliensis CCIBt3594 TaxID=1427578 RepID=A0AAW9QDT3_9CHRO
MEHLPEFFDIWRDTLQWQPDEVIQSRFRQLFDRVLEGNQRLNLTRITEPREFWEKHLWDSLSGLAWLQRERSEFLAKPLSAIDVGTGAGFPGVPLAIVYPDWKVTLLDSTRKKIDFLTTLTAELGLQNTRTVVGRAEAVGKTKDHRSSYDLVCTRAVGNASLCANYAFPFLKVGGIAILYRGLWTEEETAALEPTVAALGGKIERIEAFQTPLTGGVRHCIYLSKQEEIRDRSLKLKGAGGGRQEMESVESVLSKEINNE